MDLSLFSHATHTRAAHRELKRRSEGKSHKETPPAPPRQQRSPEPRSLAASPRRPAAQKRAFEVGGRYTEPRRVLPARAVPGQGEPAALEEAGGVVRTRRLGAVSLWALPGTRLRTRVAQLRDLKPQRILRPRLGKELPYLPAAERNGFICPAPPGEKAVF